MAYPDSDIEISEVDGNTEAFVTLDSLLRPDRVVCGTEFVQTGRSLESTCAFILRKNGIYEPRRGEDGRFVLLQEGTSRPSQKFSQALTTEVQILFAQIFPQNI